MIKFNSKIIKIVQVLIILFCISVGFSLFEKNIYSLYYGRFLEIKDHLLENNSFSIIISGNSHAIYSYKPNILDEISKDDSYLNLSTNGAGIPSIYFYLKNAINKGQQPELILLEAYTFRYNDFDESLPMLMGYDYVGMAFDILRYLPPEEHNIAFSAFFGNYKWKNLFSNIEKNIEYKNLIQDIKNYERTKSKGYLYTNEIVEKDAYQNSFQIGSFPIDLIYHEKITQAILTLCKDNNIDIILLRSPAINTLGIQDEDAQKIAEKYQIPYIDLNKNILNDISNPQPLFYDALVNNAGMVNSHTNNTGAIYSSLKLAEQLQTLGYIEINQEVYDSYWNQMLTTIDSYQTP